MADIWLRHFECLKYHFFLNFQIMHYFYNQSIRFVFENMLPTNLGKHVQNY